MSEKRHAIFYDGDYYLLPDEYTSAESFLRSVDYPVRISLKVLSEYNGVDSYNVDKGICIAPYFYSEYGYLEREIIIDDPSDVFPVDVELFTQKEYNERLREVILNYCPGCVRYKPLSNRVQSLNGHFEEIALNSVCFYRQESKPAPRVFFENMRGLLGLWYHFDPAEREPEDVMDSIKSMTYLKYASAHKDKSDSDRLVVSFKPDFFVQVLTDALSRYISTAQGFTRFRLDYESAVTIDVEEFKKQIVEANRDLFHKNCKKYGVALAELYFDPAFEEKIVSALDSICDSFAASVLFKGIGKANLLLLDECSFLKQLYYRSPVFEVADSHIKIYDQYGEKGFRISFNMEDD